MTLTAERIPLLSDNYAWLLRDADSGAVALVDPAEARPCLDAVARAGRLDLILLTHHHSDHTAATDEVRARHPAPVAGAAADEYRLPRLDIRLRDGDTLPLGVARGAVMDTPGHTVGHISVFFPEGPLLLCADTLFSLGCGRLLEGTPAQMFASLHRFDPLPDATLVCCGHEYTQSNARFALSADPDNAALRERAAEVDRLRAAGQPTVPSTLGEERAANPFLRAADAAALGDLRQRKDRFR